MLLTISFEVRIVNMGVTRMTLEHKPNISWQMLTKDLLKLSSFNK